MSTACVSISWPLARQMQTSPASEPVDGDVLDAHCAEQLHLVAPRLRDESLGEVSAADALRKSRVVVDALGDAGLAAEPAAFDHDGVDALARRVDRGRESRRAATDDRQVVAAALGLEREPELARQLLVGGLDEHVRPVEDDGRDRAAAFLQLLDVLEPGRVLVDVDPVVRNALLREESLRAFAVGAPRCAVDGDLRHTVSRVRSCADTGERSEEAVDDVAFGVDDDHRRWIDDVVLGGDDFARVVDARIRDLVESARRRRHWRPYPARQRRGRSRLSASTACAIVLSSGCSAIARAAP